MIMSNEDILRALQGSTRQAPAQQAPAQQAPAQQAPAQQAPAQQAPERDPHGLPPDTPGAKLDADKLRVDLVLDSFSLALIEVAKVAGYGARKYSEGGWQHVEQGEQRYRAAAGRHRLKRVRETHDPDSHILHLAHEAWNVLAELELALRKEGNP